MYFATLELAKVAFYLEPTGARHMRFLFDFATHWRQQTGGGNPGL